MFAVASPVFAASAPEWGSRDPQALIVHSTRVTIEMELQMEELATKWKAEYAPAVCDGAMPGALPGGEAPENGWAIADKEERPKPSAGGSFQQVFIGGVDPGEWSPAFAPISLRHLKPETCYYARFVAENADGKAEDTVPFKTRPIETPEVPKAYSAETGYVLFNLNLEDALTDDSVGAIGKIETNGADTTYSFEYALPEDGHAPAQASTSWKGFSSGATGAITVAEDYAIVKAGLMGLSPETTYYVRIKLSNSAGTVYQTMHYIGGVEESEFFVTGTAKPTAFGVGVRNVTADAAFIEAYVSPHGSETVSRLEYTTEPGDAASWKAVPGGEDTISRVEAEAMPYGSSGSNVSFGTRLEGLATSKVYYVRVSAKNTCVLFPVGDCGAVTSETVQFETSGAPKATTFLVHELVGGSLRLLGAVNPDSLATSAEQEIAIGGAPTGGTFTLTFDGQTTGPIAYNASGEDVGRALEGLSSIVKAGPFENTLAVEGGSGGPYTVYFGGGPNGEVSQPLIEGDGLGLTPGGTVSVVTTQPGGVGTDTHYHFQYVSRQSFAEHGWANPEETAPVELASGDTSQTVGEDLPALTPGEAYRFRIVAVNNAPGTGPVEGSEQTLTAPASPAGGEAVSCPNESLRTGLSARLPDCRAYEQLTPSDKEGAQEPFTYGAKVVSAAVVGEDGEHVALESFAVNYGSGSGSGQSPYFFSRSEGAEGAGWLMRAGAPQPETGIGSVENQIYSANLTQMAFESAYAPSLFSGSPSVEYKIGPAGGPYTIVVSMPRKYKTESEQSSETDDEGWAAANGDFSKLVLGTLDRTLIGEEPTPTKSGKDLYEYTAGGGLKQLNVHEVGGETVTIGSCGAVVADGKEDPESSHRDSGAHTISADGSRVFFEAVPGKNCSEAENLYMRVNGTETVDVGAYKFLGANGEGTRLLLEGARGELLGYDTETKAVEHQSGAEVASAAELRLLGIPARTEPDVDDTFARPRYTYWREPETASHIGQGDHDGKGQVDRYDDVEHVVECVSCASSFDPEPKQPAFLDSVDGQPLVNGGLPDARYVSGDGEFAFFTTPAALVKGDDDGEVPIEAGNAHEGEFGDNGDTTSPSSDIYEWRAAGVDGCAQVQGCLALITDGRGGYFNLLLGTADEGRDVVFYTRSVLSSAGHGVEGSIGEGNIYDARIGGGEAPPAARPVECEADACSTPPSAPNDQTPASLTFTGNGNIVQSAPAKPAVKPAKSKAKKKAGKRGKKGKKRGKGKGKAKNAGHNMGRKS